MANSLGVDIEGLHVVIAVEHLLPRYAALNERIVRAVGGFGCKPYTMGGAVAARWADGTESRVEGWMLERLASDTEASAAGFELPEGPPTVQKGEIDGATTTITRRVPGGEA
jgi:hypothetical protein